eukprot:gnl/Spiro4/9387_TR4956_c0_g1_i1.p1 gnl/Spiro4/9387_TR4956_c0_g1~~gnl/Spiro4/9387_TR4956_c0_g1_i1.p1  ORF type:complete len:114 (+),score=20.04 gnl/Spiro4/9387_TR4956_c0_g1_i1:54-395(+)
MQESSRSSAQSQAEKMFSTMGEYLRSELTASTHDYELLEKMNRIATEKYKEMAGFAGSMSAFMDNVEEKHQELNLHLAQIDEVLAGVSELERVVAALDDYTRDLEKRFDTLLR